MKANNHSNSQPIMTGKDCVQFSASQERPFLAGTDLEAGVDEKDDASGWWLFPALMIGVPAWCLIFKLALK